MTWDEFNAEMKRRPVGLGGVPYLVAITRALAEQMPEEQREAFFRRALQLLDTGTETG